MQYRYILLAIIILVVVVAIPRFLPTQGGAVVLTEEDVVKIAGNYVETTLENVVVKDTKVTNRENGLWKITVTYQQGTGANCKVGKCYWEGPASMYCRIESNQTLGPCE